jgi:hypothetical protein
MLTHELAQLYLLYHDSCVPTDCYVHISNHRKLLLSFSRISTKGLLVALVVKEVYYLVYPAPSPLIKAIKIQPLSRVLSRNIHQLIMDLIKSNSNF